MAIDYDNSVDDDAPDSADPIHEKALRQFDAICSAQQEVRAQCLAARRFVSIQGAQWEGAWEEQWQNSIMMEVNKTAMGVEKIVADYRAHRVIVDFRSVTKGVDENTAETLNGMFRADVYASKGQQAFDCAFEEAVQGGMGAWRLTNRYSDESDPDDDTQRVCIDIIPDADQSVFWDMDARLYDKSDAKFCFVVTAKTRDDYEAEYGDDPESWPQGLFKPYFDWYTPDVVRVAEYYKVEESTQVRLTLRHVATGEDRKAWLTDMEAKELADLKATGWERVSSKKVKRRIIAKYVFSGGGILKPRQVIAGDQIPIIPVYGKRWFIDNMERVRGHVQLAMDPQRIYNAQISKLTETASLAPLERPIFTPEQMAGHSQEWADANINRAPYALINQTYAPDGMTPLGTGPIGTVSPPQLSPVLAALIQITANDIGELTTSADNADETKSNVSAEAMDIAATRTDAKSFIYMDNFSQSMQRCGEVWLGMVPDVYVEEGRLVETMDNDGAHGTATLQQPTTTPQGDYYIANDFTAGKYKVISDVTEATSTRRDKTVKNLVAIAEAAAANDPQLSSAALATALANMDGEGMHDLQDWNHKRLVQQGLAKPTDAERAEMEQQAQNQQPSPEEAMAAAKIAETQSQTDLNRAKTAQIGGEIQSDQASTQADVGTKRTQAIKNVADAQHAAAQAKHVSVMASHDHRIGLVERVKALFAPSGAK